MSSSSSDFDNLTTGDLTFGYKMYASAMMRKINKMKKPDETLRDLDNDVRSHFFTLKNVTESTPEDLKDRILKIVRWKLMRGQFRPTLFAQAQSNNAIQLKKLMLVVLDDLEQGGAPPKGIPLSAATLSRCFKHLSPLKGLGPATITAVLSQVEVSRVHIPDFPNEDSTSCTFKIRGLCPFMADEALIAVNGKAEYTPRALTSFCEKMLQKWVQHFGADYAAQNAVLERRRAREEEGNNNESDQELGGKRDIILSPSEMSHSLWAASMMK